MNMDTIAAIATALSDSGIGIVRVCGENAVAIVNSVFFNKHGKRILFHVQSHTIHYGFLVDTSLKDIFDKNDRDFFINQAIEESVENQIENDDWKNNIIDEVMVSVMKAPNSYTREDTVEINCHGGVFVVQKVLETILQAGARLVEPGEFTKRAFLNGRIDLSEAEAVMDLISSQNELAMKSSVSQLKGDLSEKIKKLRAAVLYEIAFIESALDDPEHISLDGYAEKLNSKLDELIFSVEKMIQSADNGRLIKEGISTVILGKPNVGKSSFLNILAGKERAIVTDIAGTTRDILEEQINLNGICLNIIDTAGIRDTKDTVEKIGIEKAKQYAREADLIVFIVDSSVEIDKSDREIIPLLGGKNTIILLNKSDKEAIVGFQDIEKILKTSCTEKNSDIILSEDFSKDSAHFFCRSNECENKIIVIKTSTKDIEKNSGISIFEEAVKEIFFSGHLKSNHELVITNMRHKEALQNTLSSLLMVKKSVEENMEEDFFSIDLMNAYSELGKIIGEEVEDDLVEEIFSKFCMGK